MKHDDMPLQTKAAQQLASFEARYASGDTMPEPPDGYPAIRSIPDALVLGYLVQPLEVRDCFAPDGTIKRPGDSGFLEAHYGRLGFTPMPKGWRFETRTALHLVAVVDGNPILLEEAARSLGYPRAFADSPNTLNLGEIVL